MNILSNFKKINSFVYVVGIIALATILSNEARSQTLRNPVLEFCTGTWCQWCPCGDSTVINQILPAIPNAIILAYHGAGSDPFRIFHGSNIISSLGLSGYPTGVVDRVSGIVNWNTTWTSSMNARAGVQATVSIDIDRSYDPVSREFNATIDFTALQALSGEYRYSVTLVEDGIVWGQTSNSTCTPGTSFIPNYVHEWLVRDIMTGAAGVQIVNGTWNQNEVITKTFNYTVPIPAAPAPDIVPDNCEIVVMAYKQGVPLNANAEIQQAIEIELIPPFYVATIAPASPDVIADNTTPANFDVVIRNEGLNTDKYDISLAFEGPAGWSQEFTTVNGTFPIGQTDSVEVASGDSTTISITVNPNGTDGYGVSTLEFVSRNYAPNSGSASVRNITTTGFDILVVDASGNNYGTHITNSLDNVFSGNYGMISRGALLPAGVDLSNFSVLAWTSGKSFPVFYPEEVTALQTYLDGGGRLFIGGQDIGSDIFEPTGNSQFAQGFYNNYLHANYVANASLLFLMKGIPGDPITDGLQFVISGIYDRSLDKIEPYDAAATSILTYFNGPDVGAIKVETNDYKVVYTAFGFEQIDHKPTADTIMARSINWLTSPIVGIEDENVLPYTFALKQNYPNPFNPSTTISYTLPAITGDRNTSLVIYNQLGQKVRTLVNESQDAGIHEVVWNGLDDAGKGAASGVYFYRLRHGDHKATEKMLLVR